MRKEQYVRSDLATLPPRAQLGLFHLPRRREFLLAHAGPAPRDVLDVGCASGYIGRLLTAAGHRVVGVELNAQMAARAKARGLNVIQHDLEDPLPLADGSFDVVHACEIIEHLFDTESFLTELHRVLRPGGTLVMSTPNLNSLSNRLRILGGRSLPMWGAFPADRHGSHVRVFNKHKAFELLERTAFRPDVVWGVNVSPRARFLDRMPTLSDMLLIKATRMEWHAGYELVESMARQIDAGDRGIDKLDGGMMRHAGERYRPRKNGVLGRASTSFIRP